MIRAYGTGVGGCESAHAMSLNRYHSQDIPVIAR